MILAANAKDIAKGRESGMSKLLDNWLLNPERLQNIAGDVENVIKLNNPIGMNLRQGVRKQLSLAKRRVPGVVGVIYEARPNVTIDIAALCLKPATPVSYVVVAKPSSPIRAGQSDSISIEKAGLPSPVHRQTRS